MFSQFQTTTSLALDVAGATLVAGIILITAQRPRHAVLVLSGLAVALVAFTIATLTLLVSLHVSRLPGNPVLVKLVEFGLLTSGLATAPTLAAWALGLWCAATARRWVWFAGMLPFVLLALLLPLLFGHPDLIIGQAAANRLTTSFIYNSLPLVFGILTAEIMTPLATLVYAAMAPGERLDARPRAA